MDVNEPLALLGGLSPAKFMRRHWQRKPLLVRQAIPGFKPVLSRTELFAMASRDDVESRLIVHNKTGWRMKQGPFPARGLPPLRQPAWTLLVQGADLHNQKAHELLQKFRFVPDARLDDLMISYATVGGGVGPHFDSYDVFLLQASGRRRWKISRQTDLTLQPDVPLKILQNFAPEDEYLLEAGDMLYLPPRYAHDGLAETSGLGEGQTSDCMTYSIGFTAPAKGELAAELLHRLAEFREDDHASGTDGPSTSRYRDSGQPATASPAALPEALTTFARQAVLDVLTDPLALACALGEYMTALKPSVWFDETTAGLDLSGEDVSVQLDTRTRMMYDANHIFINGESHRARGRDARLMHLLADARSLPAPALRKASRAALELLADWRDAGWLTAMKGHER